jgi:hypothetical protein
MKRDMDLVRQLLLDIEAAEEDAPSMADLIGSPLDEVEIDVREKYAYHLKMLVEQAGLVTGIDASSMSGGDWLNLQLTWQGHDFLANTKDSHVWKKTKAGIEKIGGASWEIVVGVAKEYAKQEAGKLLGLSL